jgi:hypothetical protein
VRDLLSRVEPKQAIPPRAPPAVNPATKSFLIQHQGPRPRVGETWTHCPTVVEFKTHHTPRRAPAHIPEEVHYRPAPVAMPGWSIESARPSSQVLYARDVPIKSEPELHSPTNADISSDIPPFRPSPPYGLERSSYAPASSVIVAPIKPEEPSYAASAGKTASNDRHKLSEKHRRDGMGAYVQAADILRKGLDPGVLSNCTVCAEVADPLHKSSPPSIQSDAGTAPSGPAIKRTKNDMLADSLMWEFSIVLHLWPSALGKHLDGIRAFASQVASEKAFGLRNDFAKSNKWRADVRAEVLEQVLRTMEHDCERHGVDAWASDIMTPPPSSSSRTSPMIGQKRSREASPEDDEDQRRVR